MDPFTESNEFMKLHTLGSIKLLMLSFENKPRLSMTQSIVSNEIIHGDIHKQVIY